MALWQFLEAHQLGKKIQEQVEEALSERGLRLQRGASVGADIIRTSTAAQDPGEAENSRPAADL